MAVAIADLSDLGAQAERLIDLGLHEKAGLTAGELRASVSDGEKQAACSSSTRIALPPRTWRR